MSKQVIPISCEEDGLEKILWDAVDPPAEVWEDDFTPVLDAFSIANFARSGMARHIDLWEVDTVEHSPGLTWVMLEGEISDISGFRREIADQLLGLIDEQPVGVIAHSVRAEIHSWGLCADPGT